MAPMLGSESKDLRAELSSWIRGVKRALRALGRWIWTMSMLLGVTVEVPGIAVVEVVLTHSYACSRY